MKITDLLMEGTIKLNLESNSKDDVIEELVNLLLDNGRIDNAKKFKKAILAREKQSSTGVGDGVAIPHAKHKSVVNPALAFGISKSGIDYDSMDGKPSHIFFMIAAPEKGNDFHLEALSKLARMLIHEDFRTALVNAKTKEEVLSIINERDQG
jgi:fructose-specific phosphotransferase system IIA component